MRWLLLIFLIGCSVPEDEFTLIRSNISQHETSAERFDFNEDGVDDSYAVWYMTNGADFLAFYWIAWLCPPSVQKLALKEYAYMLAVDLKIIDGFPFDYAFVDSDYNGTLDSLVIISGFLPRERSGIRATTLHTDL